MLEAGACYYASVVVKLKCVGPSVIAQMDKPCSYSFRREYLSWLVDTASQAQGLLSPLAVPLYMSVSEHSIWKHAVTEEEIMTLC